MHLLTCDPRATYESHHECGICLCVLWYRIWRRKFLKENLGEPLGMMQASLSLQSHFKACSVSYRLQKPWFSSGLELIPKGGGVPSAHREGIISSVGLWKQGLGLKMWRRDEDLDIHITLKWKAKIRVKLWKHQKKTGNEAEQDGGSESWLEGVKRKAEASELHSVSHVKMGPTVISLYLFYVSVWVPEGMWMCHGPAVPVETRRECWAPWNFHVAVSCQVSGENWA